MTDCERLRVVFAGTPDFAAVALQALIDGPHELIGVLTQPDRPAGRGRKLQPGPVKQLAEAHGISVQQPLSLRDEAALSELQALQADVMVVAAYGLILPQSVLSLPPLGCLNIHASLLPRWRGAAPIQRALLAGDQDSGVCIMQMDAGLDTGDVLLRRTIALEPNMTGGELHDALAVLGAEALVQALPALCRGELTPEPQQATGVSYANKLDKAEALLDFSRPAIELHRQIQAFNPWPVAETSLAGEKLRIWQSRLVNADESSDVTANGGVTANAVTANAVTTSGESANGVTANDETANGETAPAGAIIALRENAVRVQTGAGSIDLTRLQRAGKKPLPAAEFCRGIDLQGKVLG